MDARLVAVIHWGFAVIGGLTAIAFLKTTEWERIAIGLAPLAVQLAWTDYVIRRARAASLEKW
jgi:UDP-GlcNAc:undecaprenyl-phosphate GlcNAc-1-phosphate transferase